ncbi:MAG: radical SAM protein [Solidesulfovibrio sp.]
MINISRKIVIIADSLGMERTGDLGDVPSKVTWPVLLQKLLHTKQDAETFVGALCARARTMDTVPDAVVEAASFGAETIIVQVGIVDCFPRVTTLEDKKHINSLRPGLRDAVWKLINENRSSIFDSAGSGVYTSLDTYKNKALQAAILAQRYGINIIFLSILAHEELETNTPGTIANVNTYNKALQDICSEVDSAHYFDLSHIPHSKDLLHDDLYHLSPEGNANIAFLLRNHLNKKASLLSPAQSTGNHLKTLFLAKKNVFHVLSGVLAAAGHNDRATAIDSSISQAKLPYGNRSTQSVPTQAFIEITNHCNLNCTMCNTHMATREKGFMSPEMFDQVVARLQYLGINRAALHTVGETLVHPQINALLSIAQNRNFNVFFSTNGQLTSRLQSILPFYSGTFNSIRFSIDAATPETYAMIRRGGKIEKVWESLNSIHTYNKSHSASFETKTNYIVSDTNKDEINMFLSKAGEFVAPNNMKFNFPNSLSPDPSFLKEIFPFHKLIYPTTFFCTMPFNTIAITFDGKISLCCRDYNGDLTIGSFLEDNPLKHWRSARAETIRNGLLGTETPSKLCAQCHSIFGADICDPFINNAQLLGLDNIGNRLWNILAAMDNDPNDLSTIRKTCKNALM